MNRSLLIAAVVGFVAAIFASMGTASLSIVPELNLRLVERLVCPPEQQLEYRELGQFSYTDADGTHNRQRISISCAGADGTRLEGKETATIVTLMGLYFTVCSVPLFAAGLLYRRSLRRPSRGPRQAGSFANGYLVSDVGSWQHDAAHHGALPVRFAGVMALTSVSAGGSRLTPPVALDNIQHRYNDAWSCPLTPFENRLNVPIRAGEKVFAAASHE